MKAASVALVLSRVNRLSITLLPASASATFPLLALLDMLVPRDYRVRKMTNATLANIPIWLCAIGPVTLYSAPPISANNSAVFTCINAASPRDSTLSRSTGSVLEPRKLKRQPSAYSHDRPSVLSIT